MYLPGALCPASSPWRAARSSLAEVAGLSNGGAGTKVRLFGLYVLRCIYLDGVKVGPERSAIARQP